MSARLLCTVMLLLASTSAGAAPPIAVNRAASATLYHDAQRTPVTEAALLMVTAGLLAIGAGGFAAPRTRLFT